MPASSTLRKHLYLGDIAENAKVPDKLLVFREGLNEAKWDDGDSLVCYMDQVAADAIKNEFTSRGRDMVCDYEHQTEIPDAHPEGKAPAAGWITGFEFVAGEGLYATITWTKQAADEIKSMQYRYFSPVFTVDDNRRVTNIHSIALTNSPALIGVRPIAAKSRKDSGVQKMKKICSALGIAEDSTEDQIVAAIAEIKTKAPTEDAIAVALAKSCGLDAKDKTTFVAAVSGMKDRQPSIDPTKYVARADFDAVKARMDSLESDKATREMEGFLNEGQRQGKITAGNRGLFEVAYKADSKKAVELLAAAPTLVTPGTYTSPEKVPESTSREAIIASATAKFGAEPGLRGLTSCKAFVNDQLRVAKQYSLTDDETKKLPA